MNATTRSKAPDAIRGCAPNCVSVYRDRARRATGEDLTFGDVRSLCADNGIAILTIEEVGKFLKYGDFSINFDRRRK